MKIHISTEPTPLAWKLQGYLGTMLPGVSWENASPFPTPEAAGAFPSPTHWEVLLVDASAPESAGERLRSASEWQAAAPAPGYRRIVAVLFRGSAIPPRDDFPLQIRHPLTSSSIDAAPTGDMEIWWRDLVNLLPGSAEEPSAGEGPAQPMAAEPPPIPVNGDDAALPIIGSSVEPSGESTPPAEALEATPPIPADAFESSISISSPESAGSSSPAPAGHNWRCQPARLLYGVGSVAQRVTATSPEVGRHAESDLSNLLVQLFKSDKVEEGCTVVTLTLDGRLRVIRVLGRTELPQRTTLNAVAWILPAELPAVLRCRPGAIIDVLRAEAASLKGVLPSEAGLRASCSFPLEAPTPAEFQAAVDRLLRLPRELLGALFHRLVWKKEGVAWISSNSEPDRLRFLDDLHLVLPPACWSGITWATDYHRPSPPSVYLGVLPERRNADGMAPCQINSNLPDDPGFRRTDSEDATRQLFAYLTTPDLAEGLALLWKHALRDAGLGSIPTAWNDWRSAAQDLATLNSCHNSTPEALQAAIRSSNRLTRAVMMAEPSLLDGAWDHLWELASQLEHWILWLRQAPRSSVPNTEAATLRRIEEAYRSTSSREECRQFLQLWVQRGLPESLVNSLKAWERQRKRESLLTADQWCEWLSSVPQNEINEVTRADHQRLVTALKREVRMTRRVRLTDLILAKIDDFLLKDHVQLIQDTYRHFADTPNLLGVFRTPNVHLLDPEDAVTQIMVRLFEGEKDANIQAAALILLGAYPQLSELKARLTSIYHAQHPSPEPPSVQPSVKTSKWPLWKS